LLCPSARWRMATDRLRVSKLPEIRLPLSLNQFHPIPSIVCELSSIPSPSFKPPAAPTIQLSLLTVLLVYRLSLPAFDLSLTSSWKSERSGSLQISSHETMLLLKDWLSLWAMGTLLLLRLI